MTDLQIGLAVIGVLAVAGVLAYNWLQERRAKRTAEGAFASRHSDVLLDEPHERREPTLGARPAPRQAEAMPDARIDYIMELAAPAEVAAPLLRELWKPIELRFAHRVLLDVAGRTVRAALQLVSRAGVVSDAELLEFRSAVETLAARLGATVSAPEMREALEAARELDRACADADIQVALHVVGVQYSDDALPGSQLFSIEPRSDGVTLALDVARTAEPRRAYEAMARAGMQLAQAGGGRIVDDNGTALDERALAAIGAQLEAVRVMLSGYGIEAGSPLALRLFS